MALNPSNSSDLEQLALKGLTTEPHLDVFLKLCSRCSFIFSNSVQCWDQLGEILINCNCN